MSDLDRLHDFFHPASFNASVGGWREQEVPNELKKYLEIEKKAGYSIQSVYQYIFG